MAKHLKRERFDVCITKMVLVTIVISPPVVRATANHFSLISLQMDAFT